MIYLQVSERLFKQHLCEAQQSNDNIANATTPAHQLLDSYTAQFYLSKGGLSGYRLDKGELTAVFSLVKKEGKDLVRDAIKNGATHLDHFQGYLSKFYSELGFDLVRTEKHYNWANDNTLPDVLFRKLREV
tara:strand:+ start:160 stop:552 length:393 start_codon:yes stop_codon:yes gene_type:complete